MAVYFCEPRSPWQRGSNENLNGLLRQGTDLSRYGVPELNAVAYAINNRPRKTLGWRSAAEVFAEHLSALKRRSIAAIG